MKKISLSILLILCSLSLYAGDIATYVNMGFSADSKVFMFGQYGVRNEDTRTYADIYVVDVKKNIFVKGGVKEKVYPDRVLPGQDGLGAIFTLLHDTSDIVDEYHINHISTGRIVYILVDGKVPKERLEFRDFDRSSKYVLTLVQQQFGSEEKVSSSFHINVTLTDSKGTVKTFTVGRPNYKRRGVLGYRIKQVVFTPDEKGLVIVVEKEIFFEEGNSIRYMVETLPLE